jgi:threonylcarbamoyladenosine tRNA methylthiotransferase MtaB
LEPIRVSAVEVVSFGCRLNIAEGEAIREAASGLNDAIIFNTCAVTAEAERQARQAIRRAAREHPGKRIIVTGCGADISRDTFAAMPEVSGIVGNRGKGVMASYGANPDAAQRNDLWGLKPAMSGADHARAFIEVQNGCDHSCTFCIIPVGRGESRSVPAGAVIEAVRTAVSRGQQEVILTGVDLTSYGPDLPGAPSLGQLVERILTAVPELPRLRLSSLDCIEIDDRLFDLVTGEPRLMPHLHLSFQSGDDMILKRMKRRHSRAQAVELVERIKAKRPDIAIGADLIAGFPTEDEAMFANTLALLDDADIVIGHIFPFSPRDGTPAARMPQLPGDVVKERAARLRERADARKADWLAAMVGSVQQVVAERGGTGHAPNFAPVRFDVAPERGAVVAAQITGTTGTTLLASAL